MKILVVEDEKVLSNTIKQCLIKKWNVEQAFDGYEGYMLAKEGVYDIILLDLMMPEMSGYDVLKKIRSEKINTPVLILTAKDSIDDKIKGFGLGADDYLTKPFEIEELIVRIDAIVRRFNGSTIDNIVEYRDLKMNLNNRQVKIKNKELNLPGKQFDILETLLAMKGTIVTKEQLFDKIWGFNSDTTTNVVEVYASGLRKELKKFGYDKYVKTIRGVGYIVVE